MSDESSQAKYAHMSDDELETEFLEPYRITSKANRKLLIQEFVKRRREQSETRHKQTIEIAEASNTIAKRAKFWAGASAVIAAIAALIAWWS